MKYKMSKQLAVAGLLAMAGVAQADTVTFDSLANADVYLFTADTYTEQGYSFAATLRTGGDSLYAYGAGSGLDADPTGATLSQAYDGYGVVASRSQGGTFTLTSFDLADRYNQGTGGTIRFDYVDALGTHSGSVVLADQPGLQTFTFDYAGLTSFTLWDTGYQLDNVVLSPDASVVPEPAPFVLLLSGLALLARRRKT